ncbi:hypothetical protein D3OALGA1CA_2591 [Olavius algarvensis associated proteobacterium Delta 3]|nr:hypothetical protein D3OALGA1CA_2591 [Olavius algarvensis associated proteobacterium Delta 3]
MHMKVGEKFHDRKNTLLKFRFKAICIPLIFFTYNILYL